MLASTHHDAETMFRDVAALDPNGMLQWEVDFPNTDSSSGFIPFLGTQIKVENDGVAFKFYRKPQKKNIVLHFKSHHTLKTKSEVAKNFYHTAEQSSSSPSLAEKSFKVINNLLWCNCYSNPHEFLKRHFGVLSGYDRNKQPGTVCLKFPYLSEYTSNQILKFIKKHNILISVTFTSGKKLRDIFCLSQPYDKPQCMHDNCTMCINLKDGCCATKHHLVYTLSTEFNPLIFQTLALKNICCHAHDLWRIYFCALHQDLSAGWCSGFTLTSCTESPELYPHLMQVIQLSHLSEFF